MRLRCRRVVGLLPALLDDELGARELGRVSAHLESCEHCSAELRELRLHARVLRALGSPLPSSSQPGAVSALGAGTPSASASFEADDPLWAAIDRRLDVEARADREQASRRALRFALPLARWLVPVSAAGAVAITAGIVLDHRQAQTADARATDEALRRSSAAAVFALDAENRALLESMQAEAIRIAPQLPPSVASAAVGTGTVDKSSAPSKRNAHAARAALRGHSSDDLLDALTSTQRTYQDLVLPVVPGERARRGTAFARPSREVESGGAEGVPSMFLGVDEDSVADEAVQRASYTPGASQVEPL